MKENIIKSMSKEEYEIFKDELIKSKMRGNANAENLITQKAQ